MCCLKYESYGYDCGKCKNRPPKEERPKEKAPEYQLPTDYLDEGNPVDELEKIADVDSPRRSRNWSAKR